MNITDQVAAMAAQSAPHIEKFAVTRGWLLEVLHALQRRSVCPHCETLPAFEIDTARTDAGGYAAMEQAAVDAMTARSVL